MSFQQRNVTNLHQMLQHPKEDDCQWYELDVNRFMEQCCESSQPAQKEMRRMPESVQDPQRRNDEFDRHEDVWAIGGRHD